MHDLDIQVHTKFYTSVRRFISISSRYLHLVFLSLVLLTVSPRVKAQRFSVRVVSVSDGDTFTAINRDNLQLKIRVYGIDAPEKKQDFGQKSKQQLSDYIFGKDIYIDVQSQDSWGRFISYVYTPDGKDVSLLMLKEGMAWHFKKYDSSEKYLKAEETARFLKKGLWSQPAPTPPWDFRKQ